MPSTKLCLPPRAAIGMRDGACSPMCVPRDHSGQISDVTLLQVKCYLSGTPECKFGLNDKLLLDNEAKAKKSNVRRPGLCSACPLAEACASVGLKNTRSGQQHKI